MKPGFILYTDVYPAIKDLSLEEKGSLLDSIFLYSLGEEIIELSPLIKLAFNFIKPSLDKGNEKYDLVCKRNRINGLKGGRPRNPDNPVGYLKTQSNPEKLTITITKLNINKNIYNSYKELINKDSKLTDKAINKINTRLKTYSIEELKQAILKFSKDSWWMEKNSDRGVAWFFDSDDRIDGFINLKPRINSNKVQSESANYIKL